MANEAVLVKQWLYGLLAGDASIVTAVGKHPVSGVPNIYDKIAPEGATYPLIVFSTDFSQDARGGFGGRLFVRGALVVRAINQGTDGQPLWAIADRIDALLQTGDTLPAATNLPQSKLVIMGCTREMPLDTSEIDSGVGVQYNYLGGRYKLLAYTLD